MRKRLRGFTLVELLLVAILVSIVMAHAVPFFGQVLANANRQSQASELIALLNLARNHAVSEGQTVTVCAVGMDNKCTKDWTHPIVAFRDPNRSREVISAQQIIRLFEPSDKGKFQANLGIRDYLRFRSSGMAREAIGNVVWCPKSGDAEMAFQLRINMGGRVHQSRDKDGDGIVEGTSGQPIGCPG